MTDPEDRFAQAARGGLSGRVQALGIEDIPLDEQEAGYGAEAVQRPGVIPAYRVVLEEFDAENLLFLKARIEELLSERGIAKLDMEAAYVVQLAHARGLQDDLRSGLGKPNERAAALTAVTNVLGALVKLRDQVVNQERMMKVESALLRIMRQQAPEVRDAFLTEYGRVVAEFGEI